MNAWYRRKTNVFWLHLPSALWWIIKLLDRCMVQRPNQPVILHSFYRGVWKHYDDIWMRSFFFYSFSVVWTLDMTAFKFISTVSLVAWLPQVIQVLSRKMISWQFFFSLVLLHNRIVLCYRLHHCCTYAGLITEVDSHTPYYTQSTFQWWVIYGPSKE